MLHLVRELKNVHFLRDRDTELVLLSEVKATLISFADESLPYISAARGKGLFKS